MAAALLVAILIGIPAGILAARYRYSWLDHTLMLVALIGVAMPVFWQAILAKTFLTQDTYGVALFPRGRVRRRQPALYGVAVARIRHAPERDHRPGDALVSARGAQ